MGRFENFTPPTLGSELTSTEITLVEELAALADSATGEFIRKSGGSLMNATLLDAGVDLDALYLRLDGTTLPIEDISWNFKKIIDLANPTADQDAATKKYVDDNTESLQIEVPAGNVNGVNTTFTVSNQPLFVVIDGLARRNTKGYTYAAGVITVDPLIPPTYDIFSIF